MKNLMEKIEKIHLYFKGQEEDAVCDFANCLKKRLLEESNFSTAYEKAADDLGNPDKVPDVYEYTTIGWIKNLQPFLREEIFGKETKKVVAV